jgi:hypothetical protein
MPQTIVAAGLDTASVGFWGWDGWTAIGAIAQAVAAASIIVAVVAWRDDRHERRQRQARSVSVWAERDPEESQRVVIALAANYSNEVVTNVVLIWRGATLGAPVGDWPKLHTLPPLTSRYELKKWEGVGKMPALPEFALVFTDTTGKRWLRDFNSDLRPLTPPEEATFATDAKAALSSAGSTPAS